MNINIERCGRDQVSDLVQLCQSHAQYENFNYDVNGKMEKLQILLFQENPPLHCYLVIIENKAVGYFSFTIDWSTWDAGSFLHMDCLFLSPAHRRKGIGRFIMKSVVLLAQEYNCNKIQWQTPAFNTNAIQFYKSIGAVGKEKVRFYLDAL